MASPGPDETVLTSGMYLRTFKKKHHSKVKWKHCRITLNSSGKLYRDEEKKNIISLTQQTRVFNSEFRDFCFVICTPSERKVTLAAESEEDKNKWIKAIEKAAKEAPPLHVKVVLVGDNKELIQSFLHKFFKQCGQDELADDILNFSYRSDNIELSLNLDVTGERIKLMLCVVSSGDYPKLRVLNYVDANAIVMCYSNGSPSQFENIERVWFPEVSSAVKKGASLFLTSLKNDQEVAEKDLIDAVIGEELANFVNGTYFSVDLELNEDNKEVVDSVNDDDDSREPEFYSPGDTFLEILQNTLEDSRGEYLEDGSSAGTDVANMNDFSNHFFGVPQKKTNFMQYVKQKTKGLTRLASRKQLFPSRAPRASFKSDDGVSAATSKKTSMSMLMKLKVMLKNLKPKKRYDMEDKPKLEEDMIRDAHFVSRAQTGSLIFLGDHMLD